MVPPAGGTFFMGQPVVLPSAVLRRTLVRRCKARRRTPDCFSVAASATWQAPVISPGRAGHQASHYPFTTFSQKKSEKNLTLTLGHGIVLHLKHGFNHFFMKHLSVKELAKAAGVTVRTLHVYDRTGLLKPALRTEKKYRYYGKAELLRLQQILFYKELGLSLAQIAALLDAPDFDLVEALTGHKKALQQKQQQLSKMMETIDKTILNLKGQINMTHEELYAGLPKEQAQQWRKAALEKWPDQVKHSEKMLLKMSRAGFDTLQQTFKSVNEQLAALKKEDPQSPQVQQLVQQHYDCILKFWGKTDNVAAAYKGLGDLYVADTRYTTVNGTADPEFAAFMNAAMIHFADTQLKN